MLSCQAIREVTTAKRFGNLGAQNLGEAATADTPYQLADDVSRRDCMIGLLPAGTGCCLCGAEDRYDGVEIVENRRIEAGGQRRNACAVCKQFPDRCFRLAVAAIFGDVIGDSIVQAKAALLDHLMQQHRTDRLGARKQANRHCWRHNALLKAHITRAVSAGMTDRAIQDYVSRSAYTQGYCRMQAGSVHRLHRSPDFVAGARLVRSR